MTVERLHKILAHAGIASRRACEEIIAAGRVTINGRGVTELGTKADPTREDIRVDGQRIQIEKHEYWLLNKPKGVVCTNFDPAGRRRPIDLMQPYSRARLFPVGRLDTESKGLLIMTNDGEFANLLAHPKYEVPKTYIATVSGRVTSEDLRRLVRGVYLSEGRARSVHVEVLKRGHSKSLLVITVREGRSRQIRRVLARLRHPVRDLVRTRIGHLVLRGIGPGRARPLEPREVEYLKRLALQPPAERRPAPQDGKRRRAPAGAGALPSGGRKLPHGARRRSEGRRERYTPGGRKLPHGAKRRGEGLGPGGTV